MLALSLTVTESVLWVKEKRKAQPLEISQ
jgi:hypothetical protein